MFFKRLCYGDYQAFKMIDHITYGVKYVKTNQYKKRSKLIFHIVQPKRLWKKPVPSFRKNKSA